MTNKETIQPQYDAIVIGAGFAGLYQVHQLRELGLKVQGLDAASDVGGTWYWNRYPGARTDSTSSVYQYLFSDELVDEWNWSERFPAQPETERYLNWVADKLDLRRSFKFDTRVTGATWDEDSSLWRVATDSAGQLTARYVVSCLGPLSKPVMPDFAGKAEFTGDILHTMRWPKEGYDFSGKRVGVVGTGATGIQIVQTLAKEVGAMTVFQRTANYTIPIDNQQYTEANPLKVNRAEMRARSRETFSGFEFDLDHREWAKVSPAERQKTMERLYADGTLALWVGAFMENMVDPEANKEISDFVKNKIRARVADPKLAEELVPNDHGFGTHRVPLENGYYEAYAQDNVELVNVKADPITGFYPGGLKTGTREFPLDVVIFATGFDAVTGGLTHIDPRGRDGQSLKELWGRDVRTALGLQVHGFPNLFITSAPLSPAGAFCNAPTCVQQSVEWITECIAYVHERGTKIEATAKFEQEWVDHHDEVANATLIAKTKSWWTGANVEGKPSRLIGYPGVAPYVAACEESRVNGYAGFEIS